jgi:hypothetical protein
MRWNLYYIIWADAIRRGRKHNPKNWKLKIYGMMSWIHATNFWLILIWLKELNILEIPVLKIEFTGVRNVDGALNFAMIFASWFFVLNYFLIFHKNRYEQILKKYPETNKHYGLVYTFTVLIAALVTVFVIGLVLN